MSKKLMGISAAAAMLAALGAAAGQAGATSGPGACEIRTSSAGGMVSLEGVLRSDAAASGTYSFRVKGGSAGGSSQISQGGEFSARAGETLALGNVTLGRGTYEATLEVVSGGAKYRCSERIRA